MDILYERINKGQSCNNINNYVYQSSCTIVIWDRVCIVSLKASTLDANTSNNYAPKHNFKRNLQCLQDIDTLELASVLHKPIAHSSKAHSKLK